MEADTNARSTVLAVMLKLMMDSAGACATVN